MNDDEHSKIHSGVAEIWMLRNQTELGKFGVSKVTRFSINSERKNIYFLQLSYIRQYY